MSKLGVCRLSVSEECAVVDARDLAALARDILGQEADGQCTRDGAKIASALWRLVKAAGQLAFVLDAHEMLDPGYMDLGTFGQYRLRLERSVGQKQEKIQADTVLEMSLDDFFTAERYERAGLGRDPRGIVTRLKNCMTQESVSTVRALTQLSSCEFLRMKGFGKKLLETLKRMLALDGLKITGE